jgi:hypothetical protein
MISRNTFPVISRNTLHVISRSEATRNLRANKDFSRSFEMTGKKEKHDFSLPST